MSDLTSLTVTELDWIVKNTRDPDTLAPGVLDRMRKCKVGPFAHDWGWIKNFQGKAPGASAD